MKVYKIKPLPHKPVEVLELNNGGNETQVGTLSLNYPVQQEYFNEQYGFDLDIYEIKHYNEHLGILNHFITETDEEWCMIFEDVVQLFREFEFYAENLVNLPEGTELFFPFDKFQDLKNIQAPKLCAGRLAHYWGSHIYFINRAGIQKVLDRKFIDRPFDEALLELSFTDNINTVYADTDWFSFEEKETLNYTNRYKSIKNAMMNHPAWSAYQKESAVQLLRQLVGHANKLGVKLMPHAGTLLGHVRHGGIMPWDDDIDISILYTDLERLLASIKEEGLISYTEWVYKKTGSVYYKFWIPGGEAVEGYTYTFPFVDFWLVYDRGNEVHMTDGYTFDKAKYLDVVEVEFENCRLFVQRQPDMILDKMYSNWNTQIQIFSWCHRTKKRMFKKLTLEIEIDATGRML